MQANGFTRKVHDVDDAARYKTANGIPIALGSCPTAIVDGYVIEDHVPAADIKRMLKEWPPVRGLAVPGMPSGAPGMEQGTPPDHDDVIAFDRQGQTWVYSRH
jgi:hypothetical protein